MTNETESRLQQTCFVWHWNTHPTKRGLFFKIKNEGQNRVTGARDKATGLIPGVADSCLLHKGNAVFIEFKTEKGVQSEKQKNWQNSVMQNGFDYFIVRSLEHFKKLITNYYEQN